MPFLNPCMNCRQAGCVSHQGLVLPGLRLVKDMGVRGAGARRSLAGAGDLVRRTGLKPRASLSLSISASAPDLEDFSKFERMMGEYRVMGIYPRGHVMQFVRLSLPPAYCSRRRWRSHLLANWCAWPAGPLPGSTPRDGTALCLSPSRTRRATCSSSSGPRSSPAARRVPGNRVILAWGTASLRDGTANVIVSDM